MTEYQAIINKINEVKRGKQQFNISDLSRLFDITSETLRKYEKKHIIKPLRQDNGYRSYSSWDITKIIRARQLKYECGSLVEVDEHLIEMDSTENIRNIEIRQKELLKEIEEKQRLLAWLSDRKKLIQNYNNNKGTIKIEKGEKIYCNIYMVGNTITDKSGDDLIRLQEWMKALPYTSVYYIGISESQTVSCVGITESEREKYNLQHLVADFIIPESEYLIYDDYAAHSLDIDTSAESINRGYNLAKEKGLVLGEIFVIRMIGYVQKDGLYKSHNLMMYPIKKD